MIDYTKEAQKLKEVWNKKLDTGNKLFAFTFINIIFKRISALGRLKEKGKINTQQKMELITLTRVFDDAGFIIYWDEETGKARVWDNEITPSI